MLVKDIMRSPAVTIAPDVTLGNAYRLMQERGIRHLPVVESGRLVGVITDRDLRLATSVLAKVPFLPESSVSQVMSRALVTASPSEPVEDAARAMRERKIGCLPVVDEGGVVGIVTGLDLLDALMRMTGVDKPSGRLELRLADHPGELARLASALSGRGINIHSILTTPDGPRSIRAVLRVGAIDTRTLAHELRRSEFDVVWPPEKPAWHG